MASTTPRPGAPIWMDLGTPDSAASAAFYGALLGWTVTAPDQEFGGYAEFLLDGRRVAGVGPLMAPEQSPSWTCYLCIEDAGSAAALVEQAGGSTLVPPMAIGDLGSMAVFSDPAGNTFGMWQPGTHTGWEVTGEEGTQSWFELSTATPSSAPDFYGAVLDWQAKSSDAYVEFTQSGDSVAGCCDTSQGTSGWLPYFRSPTRPPRPSRRSRSAGAWSCR